MEVVISTLSNNYLETPYHITVGAGSGAQDHPGINFVNNSMTIREQDGSMRLIVAGNYNLTILPSGNVGIGTNSPSEKLHVDGSVRALTLKANYIQAVDNSSNQMNSDYQRGWKFRGAVDSRIIALESGSYYSFLGVSDSSNIFLTHVNNIGDTYYQYNSNNTQAGITHKFYGEYASFNTSSLNGSNDMIGFTTYLSSGYTSNRYPVLATDGDYIYMSLNNTIGSRSGGTYAGYVSSSGFMDVSDKKFKKDITTITDPLSIINNLRGVHFYWNESSNKNQDKRQTGFIANEVQEVLPDVCDYNNLTESWGIKAGNITAVLVEGMKQQQNEINTLKTEVDTLKTEVDTYKAIIDKLKIANSFEEFKNSL